MTVTKGDSPLMGLQPLAAVCTARADSSRDPLELRETRLGNSRLKFLTFSRLDDSADEKLTSPWAAAASEFSSKSANWDGLSPV